MGTCLSCPHFFTLIMKKQFDAIQDARDRSQWNTIKNLGSYLWPKKRGDLRTRVILALSCLVLAKIVNVYVPFLYKRAVDALLLEPSFLVLPLGVIIAYGGARVLHQAFGEIRDVIFANVSQHAQRTIGLSIFQHLHSLSLAFHLERQTGGLSRIIERGTRGLQFVLSFMVFNIIPTLIEIILVTVVLLYRFHFIFATTIFITIVSYIFFTLWVTEWRLKYRRQMNQKDTEANTKAIDSLLNYETVKYFGNEEHEFKRFDNALADYEIAAIKSQTSLSFLNVGQGIIIGVGLILVMALAGRGVVQGALTLGDFVLVNTFLIQLYLPLNFLGFVYREMKQGLLDMDKMFELLDVNTDIKDETDAQALNVSQGDVEFQNVSFGYLRDREILKNISFKIPGGKTTAIVGPSGSGKSTISRLLFRFYDVDKGTIRIDGQDIRMVTQRSLRSAIGVVPQDTVLFNDSIEYNIQYGNINTGKKDVIRAAQMAKIHDFIESVPQKYDTVVGERGLKLSGGEKQRVAIARTILKNAKILLFDEATSALDSHTEKEIQASLNEVSKDRTTLVIAHRLSTIIHAHEILVLKEGEIVERGDHQTLLAHDGEYAGMWQKQQEARLYQTKLDECLSPEEANLHKAQA